MMNRRSVDKQGCDHAGQREAGSPPQTISTSKTMNKRHAFAGSTFKDVRKHFLDFYWCEPRWFSGHPPKSLAEAVSRAARSEVPSKKNPERMVVHPHQRKVGRRRLRLLVEALARELQLVGAARSFDELYRIVERVTRGIDRIGELTTYDVALRIGTYRRIYPVDVYMHTGTRAGARVLGLKTGHTVKISSLPPPLDTLSGSQAEDVLCIYKNDLRRIANQTKWKPSGTNTRA